MSECRHTVSAQVGKRDLSLYFVQEPTGALHLSWSMGTCDDPGPHECWEFGPFDNGADVSRIVRGLLFQSGVTGTLLGT